VFVIPLFHEEIRLKRVFSSRMGETPARWATWISRTFPIYFFFSVDLVSVIVDTDYDNWAVLVQCSQVIGSAEPRFVSTRILSRTSNLGVSDWIAITSAIETADASASYKFPVDQVDCDNTAE
jgi:hypothetical protein